MPNSIPTDLNPSPERAEAEFIASRERMGIAFFEWARGDGGRGAARREVERTTDMLVAVIHSRPLWKDELESSSLVELAFRNARLEMLALFGVWLKLEARREKLFLQIDKTSDVMSALISQAERHGL
jgi:hypothetical protein